MSLIVIENKLLMPSMRSGHSILIKNHTVFPPLIRKFQATILYGCALIRILDGRTYNLMVNNYFG
jgi:hypothetical protein